jgi:hypothetical protein
MGTSNHVKNYKTVSFDLDSLQVNRQRAVGAVSDTINREMSENKERLQPTKSNNSFNRSANSVAFIENLNLSALNVRPVNSGVMCPSQ